jgi:hypothetical protein
MISHIKEVWEQEYKDQELEQPVSKQTEVEE